MATQLESSLQVSDLILQGNAPEGAIIKADVEDEHIVVKASN